MSDFRNSKTKDNLMRAFAGESSRKDILRTSQRAVRRERVC